MISRAQKGTWCLKKIKFWAPLINSDTAAADEGSSVESYILKKKKQKNPNIEKSGELSVIMVITQYKEKERV